MLFACVGVDTIRMAAHDASNDDAVVSVLDFRIWITLALRTTVETRPAVSELNEVSAVDQAVHNIVASRQRDCDCEHGSDPYHLTHIA